MRGGTHMHSWYTHAQPSKRPSPPLLTHPTQIDTRSYPYPHSQFLKAITIVNGRDASVGVAPMIAALLAERPQSFVPQGRPSPPIAAIFGRFTADEVGAMLGCALGSVERPPLQCLSVTPSRSLHTTNVQHITHPRHSRRATSSQTSPPRASTSSPATPACRSSSCKCIIIDVG